MTKFLASLIFYIFFLPNCFACTCAYVTPFCKNINTVIENDNGLVWIGEFLSIDTLAGNLDIDYYKYRVKEILHGEIAKENFMLDVENKFVNSDSIIWVAGGNGGICLLTYYGSEAMFAQKFDEYYGYASLHCDTGFLVGDGKGNFDGFIYYENNESITIEDIDGLIAKPCVSSMNVFDEFNSITVSPNPAIDFLVVNLHSNNSDVNYNLLNASGELVKSDILTSGKNRIKLYGLKDGIYFLILREEKLMKTFKFLKLKTKN